MYINVGDRYVGSVRILYKQVLAVIAIVNLPLA